MKQKQNPLEFSLINHQFILTPHHFESAQRLEGLYHLQLEKGCQRIAEVREVMQFEKAREFVFRDKERFTVKVFREKNMVFSWSVYKYVDGALQFVDLLKFDLNECYSKYINDIKNMGNQYAKVLEYKNSNSEYMARAWIQMKKHLRSQYFLKEIKNSTETLGLFVMIEIQNELDRLTQLQIEKWKVTKKTTLKNEKDQQQANGKSHVSIKLESGQNSNELDLKIMPKEQQDDPKEEQEGIMCLPINQLKIKNWTVLSDIIEASNEQSHMHGEKTDRDIRNSECRNPNAKKGLLKTKTFHFVADSEFESAEFRRNNSLQAIKTGSKVDLEEHKEDLKVAQDKFTATSSITKLQLNSKIDEKPSTPSKMRYFVLVAFIFFLLIIFPAANSLNRSLSFKKQMLGNNKKIKKQRFF